MANSIRLPRRGLTASSRRIAEAVDDTSWQMFRLSMKGKPTAEKLDMLEEYFDDWHSSHDLHTEIVNMDCDICIRIDNYIKALCRGGQLEPGMTIDHFNDGCIRNHIRK